MDVSGDDLFCPEVGAWAEEKHSLVSLYAKLFSTGMKDKWEERVYIELYAGAGYAKIRDTSRTIAGSPIQALLLEHPFDKYIFCEKRPRELEAVTGSGCSHSPRSERIVHTRRLQSEG